MKYRTVIEITCEEFDKDSAIFAAGEYLRGNLGYDGVTMKTKTTALSHQRFRRIGLAGFIIFMVLSAFLFKGTTLGGAKSTGSFEEGAQKTEFLYK